MNWVSAKGCIAEIGVSGSCEQSFWIESRGIEAGAKLGLRHGLELRGVAELLHERLQRLGGRIDAFDLDSLELLRGARRRLDGGVVQIHLGQRKVRVRLEQFLALAAGIRHEQRRQRPFADELTDSFADAGGGGEDRIHVRTAHDVRRTPCAAPGHREGHAGISA